MVKLGEQGYLEDVYSTQSIWVPLHLWPGAGSTGDQGRVAEQLRLSVGVTEELCRTVVETGPLGQQSREAKLWWARGGPPIRGCGKAGWQAPSRQCSPANGGSWEGAPPWFQQSCLPPCHGRVFSTTWRQKWINGFLLICSLAILLANENFHYHYYS